MESPRELYYEYCVLIHRRISLISENCTHYDYNPGLEICSYVVQLNPPDYICICDSQDGFCWCISLRWAQSCECKIWSGDPGCTDVAAPMNLYPSSNLAPRILPVFLDWPSCDRFVPWKPYSYTLLLFSKKWWRLPPVRHRKQHSSICCTTFVLAQIKKSQHDSGL